MAPRVGNYDMGNLFSYNPGFEILIFHSTKCVYESTKPQATSGSPCSHWPSLQKRVWAWAYNHRSPRDDGVFRRRGSHSYVVDDMSFRLNPTLCLIGNHDINLFTNRNAYPDQVARLEGCVSARFRGDGIHSAVWGRHQNQQRFAPLPRSNSPSYQ